MITTQKNIINEAGEIALSTRLQRLGDIIRKDVTRIYQEHHLDFEAKWFSLIYVIMHKSPISITELADEIGYAHPSIIALVKEMERKKLIKSTASKLDGRKRMLTLTPKVLEMEDELQKLWKNLEIVLNNINAKDLLKAVEETEKKIQKDSFYERYQKLINNK